MAMNERIKLLAEQATSIVEMVGPEGYTSSYANFDREKFAESIVWECMLICENVMKKDNSALGCWSEIKRKFRS
jgi:hypothetical protein